MSTAKIVTVEWQYFERPFPLDFFVARVHEEGNFLILDYCTSLRGALSIHYPVHRVHIENVITSVGAYDSTIPEKSVFSTGDKLINEVDTNLCTRTQIWKFRDVISPTFERVSHCKVDSPIPEGWVPRICKLFC